VTDEATLARIRSLAIPPAWTDVWISPSPRGHLQATGRDARGRKQYRYHPEFRRRRDAGKYDRLIELGGRLPALRRRIGRDLARRGLPRERVLAAVVGLLERTALRVGNDEYARLNRSFGLSTLRNRHARVARGSIRFRFRGKGGKTVEADVDDRRLAAVVRRCQELPGQALFEYIDHEGGAEGEEPRPQPIDSADVNAYIRDAIGGEFSAKDLRTWAGTMLAFRALRDAGGESSTEASNAGSTRARERSAARRVVLDAIRDAADALGNTPAVARASYVHPALLDAAAEVASEVGPAPAGRPGRGEELALLRLLRRRKAEAEQQPRRVPHRGRSRQASRRHDMGRHEIASRRRPAASAFGDRPRGD